MQKLNGSTWEEKMMQCLSTSDTDTEKNHHISVNVGLTLCRLINVFQVVFECSSFVSKEMMI